MTPFRISPPPLGCYYHHLNKILAHFILFLSSVASSVATHPPQISSISLKTFLDQRCRGIPTALTQVSLQLLLLGCTQLLASTIQDGICNFSIFIDHEWSAPPCIYLGTQRGTTHIQLIDVYSKDFLPTDISG